MLAYHPKCAEVHESVGLEEFTLRTDTLLVDDLVERVDELTSARERHCERLAEHVTILRGRLHRELDAVRTDLERPTDDAALLSPSRQPD
jgi:polysaccharide pyruvyl transferase WcaK-like protein